jgi:stage III sporulation protein AF
VLDVFKQLVTSIVIVMMLSLIMEVMVPANDMQKYVKMVLGLLIILIVLTPALKVLKKDIRLGTAILEVSSDLEIESIMAMGEELEIKNQQSVIEKFKNSLAEQVRSQLVKIDGVKDATVFVSVEENIESKNFGMITGIEAMLLPGESVSKYIKPVGKIKIDTAEKAINESLIQEDVTNAITNSAVQKILKLYDVSPEIIMVYIQKEGEN